MSKRSGVLADYLDEATLARQLKVTPRTLQRWRRQRIGPAVTLIGRVPMYRVGAVQDWLINREFGMVREKKRA